MSDSMIKRIELKTQVLAHEDAKLVGEAKGLQHSLQQRVKAAQAEHKSYAEVYANLMRANRGAGEPRIQLEQTRYLRGRLESRAASVRSAKQAVQQVRANLEGTSRKLQVVRAGYERLADDVRTQ